MERIEDVLEWIFGERSLRGKVEVLAYIVGQGRDIIWNIPRHEEAKRILDQVYLTPVDVPVPNHLGVFYSEDILVRYLTRL